MTGVTFGVDQGKEDEIFPMPSGGTEAIPGGGESGLGDDIFDDDGEGPDELLTQTKGILKTHEHASQPLGAGIGLEEEEGVSPLQLPPESLFVRRSVRPSTAQRRLAGAQKMKLEAAISEDTYQEINRNQLDTYMWGNNREDKTRKNNFMVRLLKERLHTNRRRRDK